MADLRKAKACARLALHRFGLWRGVAVGIAFVCGYDGATLLDGRGGEGVAVLRAAPGGLEAQGVVMLLLAAAILFTVREGGLFARRVLQSVFAYAGWVAAATVASWIKAGHVIWGSPSKWLLIVWLAFLLLALPAPVRRSDVP